MTDFAVELVRQQDVDWSNNFFLVVNDTDDVGFEVPLASRTVSPLLTMLLGEFQPGDGAHNRTLGEAIVSCPQATRPVLALMASYLRMLGTPTQLPKPLIVMPTLQPWEHRVYASFVENEARALEMMNAASFLQVVPLVDLACAFVAMRVKGMSQSKLAEYFKSMAPDTQGCETNEP